MAFHVYDGHRVIYETLDDARAHSQAAIDEYRKHATLYEWPEMVSEIAVYEAPDDCGEPWRDGVLVLEARERVIEDEDHPLGKFSEFDLVEVSPVSDPVPARERSNGLKINVAESYVGALSPTGGPGGTPELVDAIPLAEYLQSAAETVEVFSTDPALNGTTMVVSTTPDADFFELVVADCLPDDDDPNEEPGEMCRRALAKAEADIASRMGVPLSALSSEFDAPDTITLTRDQLTSALREAAAQGMDRTSGPSCEEAASCRDVADEIVEAIDAGRFSPDTYVYAFMEEQRAIQRARQGVGS